MDDNDDQENDRRLIIVTEDEVGELEKNNSNFNSKMTNQFPEENSTDNPSSIVVELTCLEEISNDSATNDSIADGSNAKASHKEKKKKSKDESEKSNCKHESNNFKILKKRYRCADCGAIACPECFAVGSTTLHRHLQSADAENYKLLPCTLCDLHFLSQCSLQAHTRIHMLDSPYVCPDCGCIYSNIYYLTLHLINKCYHVYKVMRFRCSVCHYSYKSAETFSDHIKKVHVKSMVMCSKCHSMYDDVERFQRHALEVHNNKQTEHEQYIRCSLCVSSPMWKSLENDHVKYHRDHSISHQFMYSCTCGDQHATMVGFRGHIPTCKKKGVLPANWNYLKTKIKTQELKGLNSINKDEMYLSDSPVSNVCPSCGEELADNGNCKKCLETNKASLEISQNSDMVVIKLKDNNKNEVELNSAEKKFFSGNEDAEVIVLDDASKILYDHVPNDHLGYLKTKNGNFLTETILDEETGMLKPFQSRMQPNEKRDEEGKVERPAPPTTYADFKRKNKDSFFSCPFCSTLFFKHESSFQKFLLHVECYHNDAGIDIVADKNDAFNQKKPMVSIQSDEESEEEELPPQTKTNNGKPEIYRARVIHEDDKKSQNLVCLPKKKRMTLMKISTPPVKKPNEPRPKNLLETQFENKKTAVRNLNFQTEAKKFNGVAENLDQIKEESNLSTPSKKESDAEEPKLNDSNDSSTMKEDSETSQSSRSLRRKKTDETPKKDHEVWDEFYESLKIAEKFKFKKKKPPATAAEFVGDAEKVASTSDYSSKRVVKKPKRFMEGSGDESDEYSETEKEKEKIINTGKVDTPVKEEPETEADQVEKRVDQKFVDSLFNFYEKEDLFEEEDLYEIKDKQIDLYKKHSEIRLNGPVKDYRKGVLNSIKIRGRPKKFLNDRPVLKSDSESPPGKNKKRGRPRKPSSSSERPSDYDKEINFIEKNFESEEIDGTKRKRKLSSKLQFYQKMNNDEFSSGQLINNKTTGIHKKFTCSICKETYPNAGEFRGHIVNHRMDDSTYQCMECGECFVVRPSFGKHLHAFHKIKDIDKYIIDNNFWVSESEKDEEPEPEPLKENQCKVCKDQFDSPGDLSKHFRVHGMAFLKEFKKEAPKEEVQVLKKEKTCKGTGNVGNF